MTNKLFRIMLGSRRNEITRIKENHIKKNNLIYTAASSVVSIYQR
jgi:hypothetical protein